MNNNQYFISLEQQNEELRQRKAASKSPSPTTHQELALIKTLTFSAYRGVHYLIKNPGARTDQVSADCAIGNFSDCIMNNRERLNNILGLDIQCENIKLVNQYGRKGVIGTWWLKITDQEKWDSVGDEIQIAA